MHLFKKLILTLSLLSFSACSLPEYKYGIEMKTTNYDEIVSNLLQKASNQIFPHMEQDEIILVSNFADSLTLRSNTKLSFILSDLLKNKLVSKYSYTVREIELSNKFRLGTEGFKILTRDATSINSNVKNARYACVGTYTFTKNQIMLFLKLIDINNGNILASSTYSTDLTQEIVNSNNIIVGGQSEKTDSEIYTPMGL